MKREYSNASVMMRAPVLVREILLAFTSVVDDAEHSLVSRFGFDLRTFQFVKGALPSSLLMLSNSLVRARAITIRFDALVISELISAVESDTFNYTSPPDNQDIFCHKQVIRELLMFLADYVSDGNVDNEFVEVDPVLSKFLMKADTKMIENLCIGMMWKPSVVFYFDKRFLRERTYAQMRHGRREGIKDFLVSKRATYAFMSFLFSEENEESIKKRRKRLDVTPLKGRPRTAPPDDYIEFIFIWESNPNLTDLDRFLESNKKLGYGFDVLWSLYQKAKAEHEPGFVVAENAQV